MNLEPMMRFYITCHLLAFFIAWMLDRLNIEQKTADFQALRVRKDLKDEWALGLKCIDQALKEDLFASNINGTAWLTARKSELLVKIGE